ncbi:hypothetical protein JBO49_03890 [Serratia fonticola]|uniref:RipA family octameric membrane protein n=1 Tax=Serratia fonticola TaxID=47917 RepID=UPI00192BFCFE|nr:hypothetical protein [Serratia fonticola]MBL5859755.1 hypothetical protein [Serratia fonticola]
MQVSDIRKFEIEMYWKRATYFWTIIAVTFTGYFALSAAEHLPYKNTYSLLLSSMGMVFTFSWYLVNRGSKYWQENWENHLDLMEDEVTGPLYKTILERPTSNDLESKGLMKEPLTERLITGPSSISVSKINQWVAFYILIIWFAITIVNFILITYPALLKDKNITEIGGAIFIIVLSVLTICMMIKKGVTHVKAHTPKIKSRNTEVFD